MHLQRSKLRFYITQPHRFLFPFLFSSKSKRNPTCRWQQCLMPTDAEAKPQTAVLHTRSELHSFGMFPYIPHLGKGTQIPYPQCTQGCAERSPPAMHPHWVGAVHRGKVCALDTCSVLSPSQPMAMLTMCLLHFSGNSLCTRRV